MSDAAFALRIAIYARLSADPALVALIGANHVFDEVPRGLDPPYLVIGEASLKDWSTSSDRGHEHGLTLSVWSRQGGAKEALAIASAAAAALEGLPGALAGHRLVNLVALSTEIRREPDRRLSRAAIRLRAVTEVV